MATPWQKSKNQFDNAIHIRVKRFNQTYFILMDKFDPLTVLKNNILRLFE